MRFIPIAFILWLAIALWLWGIIAMHPNLRNRISGTLVTPEVHNDGGWGGWVFFWPVTLIAFTLYWVVRGIITLIFWPVFHCLDKVYWCHYIPPPNPEPPLEESKRGYR